LQLTVVIVSYNTVEMTLECLRSVFRETVRAKFDVIVVDNASTDGSAEAIEAEFSDKLVLIKSPENLGFAAANNLAAKHVNTEYLLLLNPDTVVLENAIDKLVDYAIKYPKSGIWGGRTVFADGSPNPASCWSKMTIWSLFSQAVGTSSILKNTTLFNPEGIGGWDRRSERDVDIVTGCFLLIYSKLWNDLSGFNKDYFMYGEEADLCLRAYKLGARPRINSEAIIIHHGGASEKILVDKMVRLMSAKVRLVRHHFSPNSQKLGTFLLAVWPFSRMFGHVLLGTFGAKKSRQKMTVWREIWQRRSEWLA